ncbi:hypothetical protein [Silvibacterium sp.]|uniref:hypothetical protein n=1 Tax=Silvibacterium sp. TaxID=1964179 RepID=UPI0039E4DE49
MSAEIILQPRSEDADLASKREQLAEARATLSERESELAQLRTQLKAFESRYMRQVGVLYADLDDIEARIAEREVDLYDSDAARSRAEEARQRAQETHDAAFGHDEEPQEIEAPPNLKTLFREVARRIHPDFARDDEEQQYFTLLMARANQAYGRGDIETLQRMLDDQIEIGAPVSSDRASAEFLRLARQLQHERRDISLLEAERHTLLSSEIAQLFVESEAAEREHRDLLTELATGLREQVEEAKRRFEFVERQIAAQGR